jgi:hypothetical protein
LTMVVLWYNTNHCIYYIEKVFHAQSFRHYQLCVPYTQQSICYDKCPKVRGRVSPPKNVPCKCSKCEEE